MRIDPIDTKWLQEYIDQLISLAGRLDPGPMRDATMLRADHILDMVKAWKDRKR